MKKKHTTRLFSLWFLLLTGVTLSVRAQAPNLTFTEKQNTNDAQKDYTRAMEAISSVLGQVSLYFVDTVNLQELHVEGLNYMLQKLDPYTVYMPKKEANEFRESTNGIYGGIGAILLQRPDSTVIIDTPMKGKAADKAGLRAGDTILRINGKDFSKTTVSAVRNELRGIPGQILQLTVRRPGRKEPLNVEFPRESIDISPISACTALPGKIGYIRLSSFMSTAYEEFKKAFSNLQEQYNIQSLIIDLRDNGGGLLQHAVNIVGMFVPQNTLVVELKTRIPSQNTRHITSHHPIAEKIPIVVLINEGSASASEIVSGALQDYDRAIVMGEKSFGKGLVQSTISLPDSALLKVTTSHYYIPSGRCIQRIQYNHKGGAIDLARQQDNEKGVPFNTKGGRVVYASGGIMPDVQVIPDSIPQLLGSLLLDTLTYDYITDYTLRYPQAPSIKDFAITDKEYQVYRDKIISNGFTFISPADALLQRMLTVLQSEGRSKTLEATTKQLQEELKTSSLSLFDTHQKEIRDYINTSIIQRYHYMEGARLYTLPKDKTVQKAATLLRDLTQYYSILQRH